MINDKTIEKIAAGLRKANGVRPVCIITTDEVDIDEVCGIPLFHNPLVGMTNNGVECEYFPIYSQEQLNEESLLTHWFREGFEL